MKISMLRLALSDKMISLNYLLIAIFSCIFLTSCIEVTIHDSSSDPIYSSVIGQKIKLKENLLALGISADNNLPADYVVLVPGVGFSGPEVVSRRKLQKGTVIQIAKVLTAESIISSKVAYVVKETDSNQLLGEEIRITLVGKSDDTNYGLDGNSYEVVD
jgi:hypothetical protein